MTDETGTVVWAADYLPFGGADVTIETIENNLRFPGQYYDSETGLHYNWNRYYDPALGRYLRADPIGLSGGINFYAYCSNNPLNYADPTGQDTMVVTATRILGWYAPLRDPLFLWNANLWGLLAGPLMNQVVGWIGGTAHAAGNNQDLCEIEASFSDLKKRVSKST